MFSFSPTLLPAGNRVPVHRGEIGTLTGSGTYNRDKTSIWGLRAGKLRTGEAFLALHLAVLYQAGRPTLEKEAHMLCLKTLNSVKLAN